MRKIHRSNASERGETGAPTRRGAAPGTATASGDEEVPAAAKADSSGEERKARKTVRDDRSLIEDPQSVCSTL